MGSGSRSRRSRSPLRPVAGPGAHIRVLAGRSTSLRRKPSDPALLLLSPRRDGRGELCLGVVFRVVASRLPRRCSQNRLLWDVSTALDERAKESGADSARCTLHALRTLVTLATTGYSAQGSARGCHLRRTPEQDGSPHLQQQPRLRIIAAAQLFGAALRFPARRNPSRDDDC